MRHNRAYSASDYAGLAGGRFDFYYGYESAVYNEDKDESGPWLFVARENGNEAFKATAEQLGVKSRSCEVTEVLLEGIAAFLEQRFPKEQP